MESSIEGGVFEQDSRRLRVETLVRLRWLAFTGQLAAIIITAFFLRFQIDIVLSLALVGLLGAVNIFVAASSTRQLRLSEDKATLFLLFDVVQLGALLYFAGGIDNPFSILFLAPVTIAAVSLQTARIICVVLVSITVVTLLCFFHRPLPWYIGESLNLPPLYKIAFWSAILVSCLFISTNVARVANEAKALSHALAAAELVLERENHLSKLDGLAAAAAHELGTPLATISLVARELNRTLVSSDLKEDLILLDQEAQRCRTILGKLTSLAEDIEEPFATTKLSVLLEQVAAPHRFTAIDVKTNLGGLGDEPKTACSPAMIYGIGNFVDNAADFAREAVHIDARWSLDNVEIIISDDGPGFPPELIDQLGEPYINRKTNRRKKTEHDSGLGLGVFIAKTLLERSGALLIFTNTIDGGARVAIKWNRQRFEKPNV
jgi:two-component system sensor histidine kinase RegB